MNIGKIWKAAAVAGLLALGGCGDDSDHPKSDKPNPEQPKSDGSKSEHPK